MEIPKKVKHEYKIYREDDETNIKSCSIGKISDTIVIPRVASIKTDIREDNIVVAGKSIDDLILEHKLEIVKLEHQKSVTNAN
jgi:uncharacterized protein YajQ (UPF0234 family)